MADDDDAREPAPTPLAPAPAAAEGDTPAESDAPGVSAAAPEGGSRWSSFGPAGRVLLGVAGVLLVAVFAYGIDWFTSAGKIPRGVTVGGVQVGGLTEDQASQLLTLEFQPRLAQPVRVQAGDVATELAPVDAGLGLDWQRTLDSAGEQPLNPFTRLRSLVSDREIGYVSAVDDAKFDAAMEGLRLQVDRAPVEGNVVFEGPAPTPVMPVAGQVLDVPASRQLIADNWLTGEVVELPTEVTGVTVTQEGVQRAVREVAEPAAATELLVRGDNGVAATLPTAELGRVLTFAPDGTGGLTASFNRDIAVEILAPQLAGTESAARDATVVLSGSVPTVVPDREGRAIVWEETLKEFDALMVKRDDRTVEAVYEVVPAEFTTAQASALGIKEVIAEFTTGGFTANSGVNIRLAAREVNGAVVRPGETFSLNGYTGTRGYAQGYIDSGIIYNGRPSMAVGGGVSQFATTLYNAAYFAGLEDVAHTEHSYFISRYPPGREATVFEGSIDLQFRNNSGTGILLESFGDSSNVTVRVWGTKTVNVESINGGRWAYTEPSRIVLPAGSDCLASSGSQGFTTSDTRVITNAATGAEVSRETRTVVYTPQPIVVCR